MTKAPLQRLFVATAPDQKADDRLQTIARDRPYDETATMRAWERFLTSDGSADLPVRNIIRPILGTKRHQGRERPCGRYTANRGL